MVKILRGRLVCVRYFSSSSCIFLYHENMRVFTSIEYVHGSQKWLMCQYVLDGNKKVLVTLNKVPIEAGSAMQTCAGLIAPGTL